MRKFILRSLVLIYCMAASASGLAATMTCNAVRGPMRPTGSLQVRVSYALPFDPYFDPSLEEDELAGGLAERIPVVSAPVSEIGVGTYLARSFNNDDSSILTVFDRRTDGRADGADDLDGTFTKIRATYSAIDGSIFPHNTSIELFSMRCRLTRDE